MLNPINAEAVIRDGGASGRFPGELHEGVAWWLGACLVVTVKAGRIVVAHDGQGTSAAFLARLCRGAVNAQHYACTVLDFGVADEAALLEAMREAGAVPGVHVSTTAGEDDTENVRIALYGPDGRPLGEERGLAGIRQLIAADRVPLPVNERAKGHVECYHPFTDNEGDER
ncbi:hypothetical protein [Streptomyces sp. NPDC058653]|uniref:hypothetical protein n=1 Tax=Streptomyces sp. NPDC058653 TaxID=3346576 RepID=UPI00364C71EC